MVNAPVSLIRAPDPDAVLIAADALVPATDWALTRALLPTLGLAARTIALGRATLADAADDLDADGLALRYVLADQSASLSISLPYAFVDRICAHRLGGAPARRTRHGRVEVAIARTLADTVAADLSMPCADWQAARQADDDAPAVIRALVLDDGSNALPPIQLRFGGARLLASGSNQAAWLDQLAAVARTIRLPVRSVLARPLLSAGEIARLAVGDVIPIRAPDRVTLLAGQYRLATGTLIERDGHAAIELDPALEAFA